MYQIIIWEYPQQSPTNLWEKLWSSKVHLGYVAFLIIIPVMVVIALFAGLTAVH